jgi:putative membrane protein
MEDVPAPSIIGLFNQWSLQPLALVAVIVAGGWYLRTTRSVPDWPGRRTFSFLLGLVLLSWTTNGFTEAYVRSLFWVWTSQLLALLLIIPIV